MANRPERSTTTERHPATRRAQIDALGPWFHNLHLPDGTQTAPDHFLGDFPRYKWQPIAPHLPEDLTGWRALDVGCNAGFYCIELARRGADVLGIDHDPRYLRQAAWAMGQFGVEDRVRLEQLTVYDLARRDERFDLVLFLGVFYHLRYPLLGLDIVAEKVGRRMVFQTMTMPTPPQADRGADGESIDAGEHAEDRPLDDRAVMLEAAWPKMAFIEQRLAGDPTNWWAPTSAGIEAMLRSTGLRVTARPGHEIWCCEPDPRGRFWDVSELDAATGRAGR